MKTIKWPVTLPFLKLGARQQDKIVAIVLGNQTSKAVYLERQGEELALVNYVLQPSPVSEKAPSREALAQHLRSLYEALGAKTNKAVLALSMGDCVLRNLEMPKNELSDLRRILKFNAKHYLQQDLPGYVFDCCVLTPDSNRRTAERDQPAPQKPEAPVEAKSTLRVPEVFDASGAPKPAVSAEAKRNPPEAPPPPRKPSSKLTVLAGGVAQATINNLLAASGDAGLSLEEITFSQIGLINASWMAMPELLPSEAVALLDIGYSHSTISILVNGEPAVTRVVDLGGHKLTSHLAEAMNLNYPTAEALKMSLPEKVQDRLKNVIAPLGKESRAAMNFFENEHDKVVGQVFVSGGSARSKFLLQMLEEELMVPCQKWNPAKGLALQLPPDQAANLEQYAPQLAAAIGLAHSWFKPAKVRVNLLAEKQEEEMLRRRDPVKWGLRAAAFLVFLMLLWAGKVWFQVHNTDLELNRHQSHLDSLQKISREVTTYNRKAGEVERTIAKLDQLSTNRFLWTLPLNAFQFAIVDGIQVVRLTMEELIIHTPATEPTTVGNRTVPGKPATCTERISLAITAKDYANPPAAEKFVEAIAAQPYFKKNLREVAPILLKDRLPLQVDPLDPTRKFILFKLECFFADKVSLDE